MINGKYYNIWRVNVGYKLVKVNVTPGENEQIDVTINVPKEPRSVIHGVVLDECNKPRKDAVVKLLKVTDCHSGQLEPITHTFTDEQGQFLFGPLCPGVEYVIKVWIAHVNNRTIHCHNGHCHEGHCDDDHHDDHCHDDNDHDECIDGNNHGPRPGHGCEPGHEHGHIHKLDKSDLNNDND
jgi:hypothetical protein